MHSNTTSPENSLPLDIGDGISIGSTESIVARATPAGRGGIGIIRVSGPLVSRIADTIAGGMPEPRMATITEFRDGDDVVIDKGILLYYQAPDSYTGEDVLEFQTHGSPVVLQLITKSCQSLGCRIARPGEFTERAFLNGKLDLAQAEAVADLIESSTEAAARSAVKSLQGVFSRRVNELTAAVTQLRIFVEAAIDFPDEEIDFLADDNVISQLDRLANMFTDLRNSIQQGKLVRDGIKVVLTGLPNAGKSSLLNALVNEDRAIVSEIPGTTRDILEKVINIDGLLLEIVDTAGIREANDEIEAEGVRRAKVAQQQADLTLVVVDDNQTSESDLDMILQSMDCPERKIIVRNKVDLSGRIACEDGENVGVSALTGAGIDMLREKIKHIVGFKNADDDRFIARERHLEALNRAEAFLKSGLTQQLEFRAGELLADDLASCQKALGEITGEVSSDDLLGLIFGSFCIGK